MLHFASERPISEAPLTNIAIKTVPSDIRANNTMAVFNLLFPATHMSRVELRRHIGLSRMAISKVTEEMTDHRIIRETGIDNRTGRGKRSTVLAIDTAYWRVIAIDLTQSFVIRGALVDLCGRIVQRVESTVETTGAITIDDVIALIGRLRSISDLPTLGVGVALPGIVDSEGTVLNAVHLGWSHLPLRARLEEALGLPVSVNNSTRMALIAERFFGEGSPNSLLVRIGQGVGAALCVNDEVVDGQAFTAGEIGHITIDPTGPVCACGRPGCLETFLSSSRLHAMIAENPQRRTQILSEAGQTLGRVLAIPAGLLDLDNIAVYGPPEIVSEAFLGSMNEEHEVGAELIAEIPVDHKPMLLVRVVYRAQDIATHAGLTQDVPTANHHRMRAAAGAVEPVGVVIWFGTVDRDTDEHVVGLEELCPLLVDQRAIGLHRVDDMLPGTAIAFAQLDEGAEEWQAAQGRLTALPEHSHLAVGTGGQIFGDICGQRLLVHLLSLGGVKQFLGQEEAILAVEVACRAGGLGNDGERQLAARERSRGNRVPGGGPAIVPYRPWCRRDCHMNSLIQRIPSIHVYSSVPISAPDGNGTAAVRRLRRATAARRYLATWSQSERAVFSSGMSKSVIAAIHLAKELSPRSTNWR